MSLSTLSGTFFYHTRLQPDAKQRWMTCQVVIALCLAELWFDMTVKEMLGTC